MGGLVNIAIRFRDGRAICHQRWTNNTSTWLRAPQMFAGDEEYVRRYIAMTNGADPSDPYRPGKPVPLRNAEYGLIVWDYMTNVILDNNSYMNPCEFSMPELALEVRQGISRDAIIVQHVLTHADAGTLMLRRSYRGGKRAPDYLPLTRKAAADIIHDSTKIFSNLFNPISASIEDLVIDPKPMTYYEFDECPQGTKDMRSKLKEIGFPMSKKEGLNV